jgi:hypothetical protein
VSDRQLTDFPIARGVSPPPRPFRRVGSPPPTPPPRRTHTAAEGQFAFNKNGPVVVRPPIPKPRRAVWALQIAGVVVLAGFCMAAGWWLMHGRDTPSPASFANAEPVTVAAVTPIAPAVAKPVRSVEKPSPPPPPPAEPKPEKPAVPPAKPMLPSVPPPQKPAEKPTTTLTFQKDILPILQAKCVLCHGDKNKFKGGLDLRTLRTLEKGGESGPAINRQEPELSPLWDSVSSGQMPPGKIKLSDSEKKKLHDWLVGGGK